jgi:hypothetical protein
MRQKIPRIKQPKPFGWFFVSELGDLDPQLGQALYVDQGYPQFLQVV